MIKLSDPVKFSEKGLGTIGAIWPSTERVNCHQSNNYISIEK
jgi:hypothetical protein